MYPMMIVLIVVAGIAVVLGLLALMKKPGSIYKNQPEQWNPMEGKKVVFVENEEEPANADGVCGHLEAVGDSDHHAGFYEKVVKFLFQNL